MYENLTQGARSPEGKGAHETSPWEMAEAGGRVEGREACTAIGPGLRGVQLGVKDQGDQQLPSG